MLNNEYEKNGFCLLENFYAKEELKEIQRILEEFHLKWIDKNINFYQAKAINSAYLTQENVLSKSKRRKLFEFVGSQKLMTKVREFFPEAPAFMNTQLFFNPLNSEQKNYWHRDIQFNPMSIEQQKSALSGINVIHFRIPLKKERGLELVPGTHKRWDDNEEYNIRMEQSGCENSDDLPGGKAVELDAGDLLVFSANMIHRGLYGLDRFAFDVIFCDATIDLVKFAENHSLPDKSDISSIENPIAFNNTLNIKHQSPNS